MGDISQRVPEVGEVGTKIIDALVAKRDGNTISIVIPKPEGFDAAVVKLQEFKLQEFQQDNVERIGKMNNFRQVALAVLNYQSANRRFPFNPVNRQGVHQDLSWRTTLLPYLDELELAQKIDLSKSPSESPNSEFANQMPAIFGTDGKLSTVSAIQYDRPVDVLAQIPDGTSNTVMLLENPAGQPWLENNALSIDQAVELVSNLDEGQSLVAVMFDGSTRLLLPSTSQAELKSLFDPSDESRANDDDDDDD